MISQPSEGREAAQDSESAKQVERSAMLQDLQKYLDQLKETTDGIPATIVNFYGITGIGKTILNSQIFKRFRQDYPLIWLDFDPERTSPLKSNPVPLTEAMEQLRSISALRYLPDTIRLPDGTTASPEDINLRFIALNVQKHETSPLIIILDHLDDLTYWKWLQEEIIKPLLDQQRVLIICSSQSPLFWHFWELREICELHDIKPFSTTETQAFLRTSGAELLAQSAQIALQGYPLGLDHMLKVLEIIPAEADHPDAFNLANAPDDTIDWLNRLNDMSDMTRTMLRYSGLLRRIEVPVIQNILDMVQPGWHGSHTVHQVLLEQVLPELREQQCLLPYQRQQPYRLLLPLRYILDEQLRHEEPERYRQICQSLEQTYYERFRARPIDNAPLLNEWLYFSTVADHGLYALDPDRWHRRVQHLFERARLPGKQIATLLYKDHELLSRLHTAGLWSRMQQLLIQHIDTTSHDRPLLNETELVRLRRQLFERLSQEPPLDEKLLPGELERLLDTIARLGSDFALQDLIAYSRQQSVQPVIPAVLQESPALVLGEVNTESVQPVIPAVVQDKVALLHSCGILTYDRDTRRYRLNDLIRILVKPDPWPHTQHPW